MGHYLLQTSWPYMDWPMSLSMVEGCTLLSEPHTSTRMMGMVVKLGGLGLFTPLPCHQDLTTFITVQVMHQGLVIAISCLESHSYARQHYSLAMQSRWPAIPSGKAC